MFDSSPSTHQLLHVAASPRGASSESLAIAQSFLDAYAETHPDSPVDIFDLWDGTLPAFGPAAAAAKMAVFAGADPIDEQARAWTQAHEMFKRFDAADHYLFSVPMWNAGIPYILKQFIDVISQPGMLFTFDPEAGYSGLLAGKKAAVIYTGAVYGRGRGPAFGSDFQQPYLEDWLRWAGVDDITSIEFRPNLATTDAATGRAAAHAAAPRRRQAVLAARQHPLIQL